MHLIIGTYTEDLPHLEGRSEGMTGVTYDDSAGSLSSVTVLAKVRNSSWVVASADGRFVYAVSETVDFEGEPGGGVSAFARDLATGELTALNTTSSAGVEPAHATIDPSGRFLLVANYRSGSVAVFALGSDGSIGELVELMQDEGSSVHPKRQTGPHAHQVAFDPVNGHLLVPDLGLDSLLFFEFSPDGKLSEIRSARYSGAPGAGPRHVAFHPDGRHLFLLNELDNTLAVLRRDGDGVVCTAVASILPPDFSGHSQASAIRVTSDGRFVFTGNRGGNSSNLPGTPATRGGLDAISIFEFDAEAESVTLRRVEPSLGLEPRDFILTPNDNLIVGNQDSDSVITFSFDPDAASLSPLSSAAVPSPACVILVP